MRLTNELAHLMRLRVRTSEKFTKLLSQTTRARYVAHGAGIAALDLGRFRRYDFACVSRRQCVDDKHREVGGPRERCRLDDALSRKGGANAPAESNNKVIHRPDLAPHLPVLQLECRLR